MFQLAWDTFIGTNPSWSFNEPIASATLSTGARTVTLPTTVNPNFIDGIYITDSDDNKYFLNQTGWARAEKEHNFLEVSNLTSTPCQWYLANNELFFDRFADKDYTVFILSQELPTVFDETTTETTNLPISRTDWE